MKRGQSSRAEVRALPLERAVGGGGVGFDETRWRSGAARHGAAVYLRTARQCSAARCARRAGMILKKDFFEFRDSSLRRGSEVVSMMMDTHSRKAALAIPLFPQDPPVPSSCTGFCRSDQSVHQSIHRRSTPDTGTGSCCALRPRVRRGVATRYSPTAAPPRRADIA